MILFLTKDLMIQSNASAAAKRAGISIQAVGSIEAAMEKISKEPIVALFVDLQTPGLIISELTSQLNRLPDVPKTIAFAQHVEEELLELAKNDVIESVITRGQFNNRLPQIMQQISGDAKSKASSSNSN